MELRVGDTVRLAGAWASMEAGAEGRVIGFYRMSEGESVAISFRETSVIVPAALIELTPTRSELAERDAGRARGRRRSS